MKERIMAFCMPQLELVHYTRRICGNNIWRTPQIFIWRNFLPVTVAEIRTFEWLLITMQLSEGFFFRKQNMSCKVGCGKAFYRIPPTHPKGSSELNFPIYKNLNNNTFKVWLAQITTTTYQPLVLEAVDRKHVMLLRA